MLAGDERAFDEMFDTCFPGLYRFALSRLDGNQDAAEEVAQTTLCRAIGKLATYRGEAALFTWLCTFCRHEISAHRHRHRLQALPLDRLAGAPEARAALGGGDAPDRQLERAEAASLVARALDRLPPGYADALRWKYLEELPVKEIARRLELSPKAAESLLTRARTAFRVTYATLGAPPPARVPCQEPSR
jgi:RNA polymerase sigma-70 factor (ECF subfamily)